MQKFTKTIKLTTLLFLFIAVGSIKAQFFVNVNGGSGYACYNAANTITAGVTPTISGATNYTWAITSFSNTCPPSFTMTGGSGTIISISACTGIYSICCTAMNGSAVIATQCATLVVYPSPTVTVTGPNNMCAGTTGTFSASGATSYTWVPGSFSSANIVVSPSVSTCYTVIGLSPLGCTNSAVSCVNVMSLPNVTVLGNDTVCRGTSSTFTAFGALTYTWSMGSTGSVMQAQPLNTITFTVGGTDASGCTGFTSQVLMVDTMCSDVWPGDANSDGVVDNTDVFEIGLAFSNTGAARTPGGNAYTAQHATNWAGTVSSGKNKCHADCNGDGTVNNGDTVAIFNNYGLTHSFKPSENSSTNPDITLSVPQALIGSWSFANIMLGDATNPVNLYGVAFDINFDQTLIDANSAYIVYDPSFLNASNQNVEFRKSDFNNGKVYGASVRVSGNNVSGSGQIGKFWFKVKSTVADNTVLNMSVSNAKKVETSGVQTALNGGSAAVNAAMATGINALNLFNSSILFYPNPASDKLTIQVAGGTAVNYSVCDIAGREINKGEFTTAASIDVSNLSAGSYLVRLQSGSLTTYKKLVISK